MSDISTDPVVEEVTDPVVSDETTIEVTVPDDTPDAPPADAGADRIDLDQFGNKLIPIKVNGEEKWVPLSEAQQGYMRQQDYTQKTQQTAAEREQLAEARAIAEALERDPEGTLKVLQDWYTTQENEPEIPADSGVPTDPAVRELMEWKATQEQAAQDAALEAELAQFEAQHGVPKDELLRFAVENNIPNLGWAYAVMKQTQDGAAQELQQRHESAEAARVAAKQGLPVEGGADRASGGSAAPVGTAANVSSVADAWALAARQLGRS